MSLIRPEVRAALSRWQELIAGAAVLALGLYWALGTGGVLAWIGYVVSALGLGLVAMGVQRGRFRRGAGGAGVVQILEGRITYFGPISGGMANLSELSALKLDPSMTPAHWVLEQPGEVPLLIPVDAEQAEALFDIFISLPGLHSSALLRALENPGDQTVVIWRRTGPPGHIARLH